MVESKKISAKKQSEMNANAANMDRAQAAERHWLKGNKTSMEQNIIDAGRTKPIAEKKA